MLGFIVFLIAAYIYLAILFGYHFYVETRSGSEYASPEWYARRPTEPTHNLCMSVVAGLLAFIALIIPLPFMPFLSTPSVALWSLAILFWAANSVHRFLEWYWDEYYRGTLPF